MATRSSWKGNLKLRAVSIPAKAYSTAVGDAGQIHLNQLHQPCNNRIQYKKTCPVHGEVPGDEIVMGYDSGQGQYVLVDTAELDKLRTTEASALSIDAFVTDDAIDPIYYAGKHYYVLPDGPVGARPFAVVYHGMLELKCHALAQVVLHGREQLVLLRPRHNLLIMSTLHLDQHVTRPSVFGDDAPRDVAADELALLKKLMAARSLQCADLTGYADLYNQRLTKLIEEKVAGREVVAAPVPEPTGTLSMLDALKQSLKPKRKSRAA